MRTPIYRSRRVEPMSAVLGGERIHDIVVKFEGNSNVYLIETPEGNIQINAGMAMEAPTYAKNIDSFNDGPVKYLILTQGHVDHVGGVAYFRRKHPGLQVIATSLNPEHQAYDARLFQFRGARSAFRFRKKIAAAVKYYKEHGLDDFPEQDVPTPDILFDERHSFTLGGLEVECIAVPGAETNDSLIVWLPQHRIVFTGNLFGCPFGHFPNLITIRGDRYRDALTCAAAVETVRELGAEMIAYGHHDPIVGKELIEEELTVLRDAIHYVHDAVVEGMNAGKDVHTLMQEIELPPELEVGQGYGKVNWSVRAIWEHYAGWFHHESTTELYSVPRSSVNTDLIELAGGTERIVDRAREKLAAGAHEECIHLLDIVLAERPDDPEAVDVAIAVHERLLAESENFWLTGWLEHQIALLRARSA